MDNVSHTLAGVLAAEVLLAVRRRKSPDVPTALPRVAWITSAVANNLPDSDFVYTWVTEGKLGYLLHHRGHTHTLVFALGLAALLWLAVKGLERWRGWGFSHADHVVLGALAVAGPLLHLGLDWTNSYGVHPFWPFDNRWYYGDSIFIIEPLFWAACIPLLLHTVRWRPGRWLWAIPLVGILALAWAMDVVRWPNAAFLTVVSVLLFVAGRNWSRERRAFVSVGASLLVFVTFAICGRLARHELEANVAAVFPEWRLRDAIANPLPANPLCWQVIAVMTKGDERYALRRAQVSAYPSLREAATCPTSRLQTESTAPLGPAGIPVSPAVAWRDGLELPLEGLRGLATQNCHAEAFLRFARAPFWLGEGKAVAEVMGDLRFDREAELGFAEIPLAPTRPCPSHVPPWVPPTHTLLD